MNEEAYEAMDKETYEKIASALYLTPIGTVYELTVYKRMFKFEEMDLFQYLQEADIPSDKFSFEEIRDILVIRFEALDDASYDEVLEAVFYWLLDAYQRASHD